MKRKCGDCTLCCRLLPIPPLGKVANQRCKFARHGKGCTVHGTARQPNACKVWHCRWLINDDAADLPRPDRAHYVIDMMPDEINITNEKTGEKKNWIAIQVWVDPKFPEAWKDDDAFFAWVKRKGEQGFPTLLRINDGENRQGIGLLSPAITGGDWQIVGSTINMNMGLWK